MMYSKCLAFTPQWATGSYSYGVCLLLQLMVVSRTPSRHCGIVARLKPPAGVIWGGVGWQGPKVRVGPQLALLGGLPEGKARHAKQDKHTQGCMACQAH